MRFNAGDDTSDHHAQPGKKFKTGYALVNDSQGFSPQNCHDDATDGFLRSEATSRRDVMKGRIKLPIGEGCCLQYQRFSMRTKPVTRFTMRVRVCGLLAVGWIALANVSYGDEGGDDAFFESKIRPLLVAKCQECHGSDKPKAGLQLDSREAILAGGESGPAAISGKPDESLLMDVIGYRNSIQMPPKSKLPDAEIAVLTEWVRRGLPWPNSKPSTPSAAPSSTPTEFTDEQKAFWAFQPVKRVAPPVVQNESWIRSPIDRFVLAELSAKGLSPARETDRRTLLRRVTLDLIGLPPTPDEVADFVADQSPDALERVVDRLLASPHYGERWARHWLDIARYADSNGLDENLAYANAFQYRDYVVRAMRDDKPYHRFLVEQIAGDLLPPAGHGSSLAASSAPGAFDPLIATGFLSLGAKMLAEDDPVKMQMDIIDEQVDTIARAVMGLTMGCARCHDHKFDPLTAEDYYGLAGVFKSTQTMDTFTVVARWHERPLASAEQIKARDELQQIASAAKQSVEKLRTEQTEAILADARSNVGAYIIAATREVELARVLSVSKPRGPSPAAREIPGAILIEAEEFVRGNVLRDRDNYGKEIGVIVNRGDAPNFVEYDIEVARAGMYQLELRYAAVTARPTKLFVNRNLVKTDAASQATGSWTPDGQAWFVEAFVTLNAGQNVIRLEHPRMFPHIDKILMTPFEGAASLSSELSEIAASAESSNGSPLMSSLTLQWRKAVDAAKSDPKSILTAWQQYLKQKSLTVDASLPENGVARLLGDSQPTSLIELKSRYQRLFAESTQAWTALKATDAGKDVAALPDPVLESARQLLIDPKGPFAVPADIEVAFSPVAAEQLRLRREELARHEAAVPKFTEVMAVAETAPEKLKIHLRGSHLTLGREVSRQIPKILAGSGPREFTEGSGRLQLARWLASPEHPLTARVMVNRLWQWHFGFGLVRTPDNFGRLGERPSHPELLDWLASRFSRQDDELDANPNAWSLKSTHRMLIGSSAYRQSTEFNDHAALVDPENRLLWRFHRQRMDVEVLRDSLLALSGRLDETPGGTLLPTRNREYVTSTANVNPAIYGSPRRSIYLPVVRSALFQVFTAFDFADPSTLAGQRDQTTVAPQALFMMNSAFVLEQSQTLAQTLLARSDLDKTGRIQQLYELVFSRRATDAEVTRGLGYVDRLRAAMTESGIDSAEIESRVWTSLCRAVLSANEFVYVD